MKMLAGAVIAASLLSGCATYRITSNIPSAAAPSSAPVALVQGEPHRQAYKELGPIQITVRKGSPFVATPTREQADRALIQKGRDMGAEAVIRIEYESGFDVISWGHISARGVGIRFVE